MPPPGRARLDGLAATFDAPNYAATGRAPAHRYHSPTLRFTGLALKPHFTPVQMALRQGLPGAAVQR